MVSGPLLNVTVETDCSLHRIVFDNGRGLGTLRFRFFPKRVRLRLAYLFLLKFRCIGIIEKLGNDQLREPRETEKLANDSTDFL